MHWLNSLIFPPRSSASTFDIVLNSNAGTPSGTSQVRKAVYTDKITQTTLLFQPIGFYICAVYSFGARMSAVTSCYCGKVLPQPSLHFIFHIYCFCLAVWIRLIIKLWNNNTYKSSMPHKALSWKLFYLHKKSWGIGVVMFILEIIRLITHLVKWSS